ncbi:MAG: hypothetical protein JOY92_17185 [Verrucomicrobia bacterium]|nr:hypothetical protein [Verrucomicrobiota bacterium]
MLTFGFPRGARFGRAGAAVLCAGAILALAGCGDGGPKRVKVTGKVYYQDKPYPRAHVWFIPESPSDGQPAQSSAMAEQDGSFTMTTPNTGDGVVPGRYKVGIRLATKGPPPPPGLQKYSTAKTTPITVDVPPEGLTDYELRLK